MKKKTVQADSVPLSEYGQAAQWGASYGLKVFPLGVKSKQPQKGFKWKEGATDEPDAIREHWTKTPAANVGWRTGEPSGVFVIDVDGYTGNGQIPLLEARLGRLPDTVTVETPGKIDKKTGKHKGAGSHLVYAFSAGGVPDRPGIVPGIDIKSSGGYCVFPPSVHPDGTGQYHFAPGRAFGEIEVAECPPAWLDFIRNEGKPEPVPKSPCGPATTFQGGTDAANRFAAYCRAIQNPPAQDGTGHKTLLSVANDGVHGFCLEPETAASIAWEHLNPRCCPPWSEEERYDFERKFTEAANKPISKERGYKLNAEKKCGTTGGSAASGADIPDWMTEPEANRSESSKKEKTSKKSEKTADSGNVVRRPKLIDPSTLEEKETDWLWPNKIPAGELTLLAGMPGQGKTFWSCYLSAVITNGLQWPDGTTCRKGSVLFFLGEDSIDKTYKPRLRANGADQTKIRFLAGVELVEPGREPKDTAFSMQSIDDIEEAIRLTEQRTGEPVLLVVIDPIANHWGGAKENENAEVRAVLSPLNRLAERMQTAFLLIQHTGKGDKDYAQHRVLGSTGIVGQCRNVWGLYPSTEHGHRLFAPIKANLCIDPTAVDFTIDSTEAGGQVQIVNASLNVTGDDIEAIHREARFQSHGRGRKSDRSDEAEEWLTEFLAEGWKPAGSVDDPAEGSVRFESKQAGFSWRTIERVAKRLNVAKRRDLSVWFWSLPGSESSQNSPAESDENSTPPKFDSPAQCNFGGVASSCDESTCGATPPSTPEFPNFGGVDEKPPKGPKRHRASKLGKEAAS